MNTEQLKQIFDENADCYSATINGYFSTVIGSAMSPDKFIEVVSELLKPTDRYKTLMYAGNYIDTSRLYQGIYSTNIPHIYPTDYTIEHLLESNKKIQEIIGKSNIPDSYFENIEQCKLVDIYISHHKPQPPNKLH